MLSRRNTAKVPPLALKKQKKGSFPTVTKKDKLSWKETYCAMAADREDWSDLDTTVADGLD